MKILLDTHTFLWWNANSPLLSEKAHDIILGGQDEIYLSAASAWEIAIKVRIGRLVLTGPPERYVFERMAYYRFLPLPVYISHACHVFSLPNHHNDPFDRLMIAQCQLEEMALLSADKILQQYDLKVIW